MLSTLNFMLNMSKYYGLDKFQAGDSVRIVDRNVLDDFVQSWKFHHPVQPDQLPYAGQTAKVSESAMYHGGDILYVLVGIPGMWHQRLLMTVPDSN